MMSYKFEMMRKKEVVIFYLLSREFIGGAVLQNFRSVAARERRRLHPSQVASLPSTYTENFTVRRLLDTCPVQ